MSSSFFRGKVRGVDLDLVDNSVLSVDDHEDVKSALLDVTHRWTHIGGAFRLRRAVLKSLPASDAQECLAEVISSWLEQDYNVERFGGPTWRWVVKAVAEEAGGSNPALAEKIAKRHPMTYRSGAARGQHTPPAPRQPITTDESFGAHPPGLRPSHHASALVSGITDGLERRNYNGLPDDASRVATDSAEMELEIFEPYPADDTTNWKSVALTSGEVAIARGPLLKQNPYAMNVGVHGIAVVINNEDFDAHSTREGTGFDERNLVQTLRYLRYKVEVYRRCTSEDITRIFQSVALRDHSRSDSFVCCILSHGIEGKIYGCDSKAVELDSLTKRLNASNCKSLAGKPKVFFIQACRGERKGEGVRIACDGGTLELPNEADFLFSYATPLGQASFRDLDHGSWYVTELCKVLCRSATHLHLNDILTEVNRNVGRRHKYEEHRQAPEITHRLQSNVYFF